MGEPTAVLRRRLRRNARAQAHDARPAGSKPQCCTPKLPTKAAISANRRPRTRNYARPQSLVRTRRSETPPARTILRYAARPRWLSIQRRCFDHVRVLFAAAHRSMTALGARTCAAVRIRDNQMHLPDPADICASASATIADTSRIRWAVFGKDERRLVVDEKLRRVARPNSRRYQRRSWSGCAAWRSSIITLFRIFSGIPLKSSRELVDTGIGASPRPLRGASVDLELEAPFDGIVQRSGRQASAGSQRRRPTLERHLEQAREAVRQLSEEADDEGSNLWRRSGSCA